MAKTQADTLEGLKLDDERIIFTHEWGGDVELGTSLTNAIAILTNAPQERVASELGTAIDFDAIDRLFVPCPDEPHQEAGTVVLYVEKCLITIDSDGTVSIERTASDKCG